MATGGWVRIGRVEGMRLTQSEPASSSFDISGRIRTVPLFETKSPGSEPRALFARRVLVGIAPAEQIAGQ